MEVGSMAKKRKEMGLKQASMGLVGGATILGVGGAVVGAIPGTTAATAGGGITAAASFLPTIGVAVGAGLTLQQLRKLEKVSKKRK